MRKFRVGEVVYLTVSGFAAKIGACATVKGYSFENGTEYVELEWVRDGKDKDQRDGGYSQEHFKTGNLEHYIRRELYDKV